MSNEPATSFLPPAVGALPVPIETTPGVYVVITAHQEAKRPWGTGIRQKQVSESYRIERRSTRIPQWRALSEFSLAFRGRMARGWGSWTPIAIDLESKLRQELLSYARLEDNWDGDGAKAPSQEAVNDAMTFLDGRPRDIPVPYPEEGVDGDVGVYWDNSYSQVFAEVTFEGDGTCAYFAVQGVPGAVTKKCGDDGLDVADPWPDDLLRILREQEPA